MPRRIIELPARGFEESRFGYICSLDGNWPLGFFVFWLRISMDRISDSDSEDAGSIPAGATKGHRPVGAILKMQSRLLSGRFLPGLLII
jgi:hypothetical protein